MDENKIIKLCEDYVYAVWRSEYFMTEYGGELFFTANTGRMDIHERLVESMGFPDTYSTREICYNLDSYINYKYSKDVDEMDFEEYGKRLYKALKKLKEQKNESWR